MCGVYFFTKLIVLNLYLSLTKKHLMVVSEEEIGFSYIFHVNRNSERVLARISCRHFFPIYKLL